MLKKFVWLYMSSVSSSDIYSDCIAIDYVASSNGMHVICCFIGDIC